MLRALGGLGLLVAEILGLGVLHAELKHVQFLRLNV